MKPSLAGIALLVLICVTLGVGLKVAVDQAVDSADSASEQMLYRRDVDQRAATVKGCGRTNARFARVVRFIHSTAHARRQTGYPQIAERYDRIADEILKTFPSGYVYGKPETSAVACENAYPEPEKP